MTSIKDYVEVVHKFIETDPNSLISSYENFGSIVTYLILSTKNCLIDIISLNWLNNLWSLPIIIPEVASSMISEISVLNNYFHNIFTFLETPLSYGEQNSVLYCLEKFSIGLINSFFLFLPTSTSHLIMLRRFVMQGLEAGYIAGLGTICGNVLWIASMVFGWRFIIIPWISFDILRYFLGFILLVKYMWDTYNEKKLALEDLSKVKIFLLSFLLAFTEQTTIYPFIANLSIGSETTVLETFPVDNLAGFITTHLSYLSGILIGSLSLLHLSCWFFENPAFNIYMWIISSFKVTTSAYSKFLNFFFLYLTMICAVSNFAYFGLDYTITNPLGFVQDDRLIDQKSLLETSFLSTKASDRNTRRNRGRHGRRERWKRRIRKYRTFDASLYDQGIYDLFTVENLNYGFDRFWLRRKMRNHRVRFRFFPGPWMRSFKKQLATPRLESFTGPRVEFFRMLFEQVYHPSFHEKSLNTNVKTSNGSPTNLSQNFLINGQTSSTNENIGKVTDSSKNEFSAIRKFVRKFQTRIQLEKIKNSSNFETNEEIHSKRWKNLNSKYLKTDGLKSDLIRNNLNPQFSTFKDSQNPKNVSKLNFNKKDVDLMLYRNFLQENDPKNTSYQPASLLHPAKFYLQREKAFRQKLRYYGIQLFRNFGIENNAPYFRVLMRKYFYYYKPTLRWKRTMHNASLRKALRKGIRKPRRFKTNLEQTKSVNDSILLSQSQTKENAAVSMLKNQRSDNWNNVQKPTHWYSVIGKRASRYRAQIYKDVLQHWYYSPFNRFFLKVDIDSFIRRQPVSHFLTKKEEYLLHLRRFLLSEHYDSLRWYTYMQHYQTMKKEIGGTKSFSSRVYNQQFQGTFKQVRHLFALTPNEGNKTILKFDQPLFNEYSNKLTNSMVAESFLHEELLPLKDLKFNPENNSMDPNFDLGQNLVTDSKMRLKNYMLAAKPVRQKIIQQLLLDKNYPELSKFLLKGEKTRGEKAVTGEKNFLNQESQYLLTDKEKTELSTLQKEKLKALLKKEFNKDFLWILLLKKAQTQMYDPESLKFFYLRRLEKRERRQERFEKNLKVRIERLQTWFKNHQTQLKTTQLGTTPLNGTMSLAKINSSNLFENELKTGIQKAFKEALNYQNSSKKSDRFAWSLAHSKLRFKSSDLKEHLKKNLKENINNLEQIQDNISIKLSTLENDSKLSSSMLSKTKQLSIHLQRVVSNKLSSFLNVSGLSSLTNQKKTLSVANWRQQEIALTKRKRSRKRFKRLKKKQVLNLMLNQESSPFKDVQLQATKTSSKMPSFKLDESKPKTFSTKIWNQWIKKLDQNWSSEKNAILDEKTSLTGSFTKFQNYFEKKFKIKRSRRRGYSKMRQRSAIRKSTLKENFRRRRSKKYSANKIEKGNALEKLASDSLLNSTDPFVEKTPKYRRLRQRKNRFWKKAKRPKYAQNKRRLKKHKRSALNRLRDLNKQLKRIESSSQVENWWSNVFLPRYQSSINIELQNQKTQYLKEKLGNLSSSDLLNRDTFSQKKSYEIVKGDHILEIGNLDYKPLATPNALKNAPTLEKFDDRSEQNKNSQSSNLNKTDGIQNFYENLLINKQTQSSSGDQNRQFMVNVNPTPFYAGWDETLRKFVVTNRFLSRQEASFEMNLQNLKSTKNSIFQNLPNQFEFTKAPLQGMNAATTLYWQIPFTTYDPDQFFALGMDGFSPLAWKRFNFRHMKQTTKPILVKTLSYEKSISGNNPDQKTDLFRKLNQRLVEQKYGTNQLNMETNSGNLISENLKFAKEFKKARSRRLIKRYRRVKKHPKAPVWFPAGPLSQEILPVHYIYVFYKRFRLPRDRYIRRRLRKNKDGIPLGLQDNNSKRFDYTLRRRIKARRRYHRSRPIRTGEILLPRRKPLQTSSMRPIPTNRLDSPIQDFQFSKSKFERRRKLSNRKDQRMNMRIRQLRRRVQRQVIRPINWRYRPRPGGIVWPGDYLRLESVNAPKLNSNATLRKLQQTIENVQQKKTKRKKKRVIQEWQIQPKKYLIQKHNLKVLKKRLEKSQNQAQLFQKIENMKVLLNQ